MMLSSVCIVCNIQCFVYNAAPDGKYSGIIQVFRELVSVVQTQRGRERERESKRVGERERERQTDR